MGINSLQIQLKAKSGLPQNKKATPEPAWQLLSKGRSIKVFYRFFTFRAAVRMLSITLQCG